MASAREKPRKAQGIRIDSSLISTASSGDVQNGLEGLGVSVFDQGTFEEGVMKQLDEEVTRRNAEQRRKFLMQEYAQVKQERGILQRELELLSKKIAALLSRPLCDVVLTLREMKSAQEQKRKQVVQLEKREQELLKGISGQAGDNEETNREGGVARDAAFTVPMTSWSSDQQKLIQSGHMTPFGTSDLTTTDLVGGREGESSLEKSNETATLTSSGLRLCSEGFGGLFDVQVPAVSSSVARRKGKSPQGARRKGKGRDKSREVGGEGRDRVSVEGDVCEGASGEGASGEGVRGEAVEEVEWIPTREEVEELEREMEEEGGWGEEEDEDDKSTEYSTDEELGADHVLGRVGVGGKKTKKRRRRPLSSGESEDGEGVRWGRRRKRRRRRESSQANSHLDDGDEELFQLRILECGTEPLASKDDKMIDGRLRVPGSVWSRLYGYQRTGVHWLWELHCQQAGGIVGDEMGLGKTIQMIAFLAALRVSRLRSHVTREVGLGPVLIVCPATVMHQWVSEFHTWWPAFRAAVLHDTGTHRGPKPALIDDIIQCAGVLITTYAGVRIYRDHLLNRKWDYVILDEGHKIRNPDSEVTLVCKQFATPHRIILSGSPMQNNLKELWSLFDFAFPGKLGTLPVFMEQFSVPITLGGYSNATQVQVQTAYRCACILRDTINPYLLRRLKADVKIQLPSKNEQVLFCKLTDYQRELYEDYVTGPDVAAMMTGRKKVHKVLAQVFQERIFTGLTVLRKLCNHPDFVTNDYRECVTYGKGERVGGWESGEEGEDEEDTALIRTRRPPWMRQRERGRVNDGKTKEAGQTYSEERFGWGQRSGKMIVVEALLKMWREQKHRVLLFSQSKMMLGVLELMMQAKGYTYVRMDGTTPIKARQPLIKRFNSDTSIFTFLLTTRVGGLGVNLTGADRVVIYDPDWNPSTDTQARERAWRIGQRRQVTIYRLLTSGTIEEKIYHRQIFKQFLSNRVLKDPRQRRFFKANDLYELFSLGQICPKGETETSAIFAGTGSDVVPKKLKKRKSRDRDGGLRNTFAESCDSGVKGHDKSNQSGEGKGKKRRSLEGVEWNGDCHKRRKQSQNSVAASESEMLKKSEEDCGRGEEREVERGGSEGEREDGGRDGGKGDTEEGEIVSNDEVPSTVESRQAQNEITSSETHHQTPSEPPPTVASRSEGMEEGGLEKTADGGQAKEGESQKKDGCSDDRVESLPTTPNVVSIHNSEAVREKKEKKKRKRHKHHSGKKKHKRSTAMVDGVRIAGLDRTGHYTMETEDSQRASSHDDYILTKLFKKSGVQSAIQHDSVMSSASSDYVVIEGEAKKVAQSAARALRESRRRCLGGGGGGGGGWGQLTWTGQHGSAGGGALRQQPRFGVKVQQTQSNGGKIAAANTSQLFSGEKAGTSLLPSQQPSQLSHSHTSSSALLTKMRSRNAHSLPQTAVKGIHESTHDNLMREIRDFIATRCKFDGQATTEELLGHFSSKLLNSDTATFRSMLREICDFSRIHGQGRWILRSQFR